jgi:hypothetical protein
VGSSRAQARLSDYVKRLEQDTALLAEQESPKRRDTPGDGSNASMRLSYFWMTSASTGSWIKPANNYQSPEEIKVMVVLRNELGEAERQHSRQVGMAVTWEKGDKVIGHIVKRALNKLKALPEVVEAELSSPLRTRSK